jgi:hypothetical protein
MSKNNFSIKNRLFLGVAFLLLLIVLIWILSWHWASYFEKSAPDREGSVQQTIDAIGDEWQEFKENTNSTKEGLGLVLNGLLQTVREEEKKQNLVQSVLTKIRQEKSAQWPVVDFAGLQVSFPETWQAQLEDDNLILTDNGQVVLTLGSFASVAALPDNINQLNLVDWLTEQVDRELGVFSSYQTIDSSLAETVYLVNSKDGQLNYFWQAGDIYWLQATAQADYQADIKLIISNIKNNEQQEDN